jgi:hypothetical protein
VTLGDEAAECVWVTTVRYPHAARIAGSRWAHLVTNWKNWGWLDLNTKALFVQDWAVWEHRFCTMSSRMFCSNLQSVTVRGCMAMCDRIVQLMYCRWSRFLRRCPE